MRGDGAIRSAIGSLRRGDGVGTGTACGDRGAATEWVALKSTTRGAGFADVSTTSDFGRAGLATNGAGRAPVCRNTALTTMTMVAATAPRMANESTGRSAKPDHSRDPTDPARVPARALPRR